jgi:hypothetical protein
VLRHSISHSDQLVGDYSVPEEGTPSTPVRDRPEVTLPFYGSAELEFVADALLKQGYSDRIAEKVLGLNFRRVLKNIWTVEA